MVRYENQMSMIHFVRRQLDFLMISRYQVSMEHVSLIYSGSVKVLLFLAWSEFYQPGITHKNKFKSLFCPIFSMWRFLYVT
jgi:hypothetical protein